MKRKTRRILTVVLSIGFAAGLSGGIWSILDKMKGEAAYSDAASLAGVAQVQETQAVTEAPEKAEYIDPVALELAKTDLAALREVNGDVVGWIIIPDTELSYPIVQGEDNDYYLNRTWKGERSSVGSIFLEHMVSPDFSDFNTIIYGHRMLNESMFGSLKHYDALAHWEAHPSVYVIDDSGVHRYDIFAAHEADAEAVTFGLGISSETARQAFIDHSLSQSVIDTGIVPAAPDQILTLSTCTGRGYATRWVVQAVLRDGAPPPAPAAGR